MQIPNKSHYTVLQYLVNPPLHLRERTGWTDSGHIFETRKKAEKYAAGSRARFESLYEKSKEDGDKQLAAHYKDVTENDKYEIYGYHNTCCCTR